VLIVDVDKKIVKIVYRQEIARIVFWIIVAVGV